MASAPLARRWLMPLLAMAALAWTLQNWLPAGAGLTRAALDRAELLQGSWLREYNDRGVQVRRLLDLSADGAFREQVRVVDATGQATTFVHEGTWLYDGTNLKRKYTLMNGEPPSRLNVPFATFEIDFRSRNDFVGVDHVHGHRIEYHRVGPQTLP
jgi:hypothetical protein